MLLSCCDTEDGFNSALAFTVEWDFEPTVSIWIYFWPNVINQRFLWNFYWNYISLSFPVLWKDHKGHIKNVATDNTYGDWSTTIIDSEIISLERPRHHPFHGHSRSFQNRAWKLFKVFSYKINVWHTRLG